MFVQIAMDSFAWTVIHLFMRLYIHAPDVQALVKQEIWIMHKMKMIRDENSNIKI